MTSGCCGPLYSLFDAVGACLTRRGTAAAAVCGVIAKEAASTVLCPTIDINIDVDTDVDAGSSSGVTVASSPSSPTAAATTPAFIDLRDVASTAPAVILVCNPNAGLLELNHRCSESAAAYTGRVGVDVVVWNYRGYGRSGGTPTPARLQADAAAIVRVLRERLGVRRIIAHGESIGGVTACHLAGRGIVDGVLADRTLDSLPRTASHMMFPAAGAGLGLVTRWVGSNGAALLAAAGWGGTGVPPPAGCDADGAAGRRRAATAAGSTAASSAGAGPARGRSSLHTQLLAAASPENDGLSLSDAAFAPHRKGSSSGDVSASSTAGACAGATASRSVSSALATTGTQGDLPLLPLPRRVLRCLLWDVADEVIHWRASVAAGVARQLLPALSIRAGQAQAQSHSASASLTTSLQGELRSLSLRLWLLCVLWKRAALRGCGEYTPLNQLTAFAGHALAGFEAQGMPAQGITSAGSDRDGTAASAAETSRGEPASPADAAAVGRLSAQMASVLGAAVSADRTPLLWQAAVAHMRGGLFARGAKVKRRRVARLAPAFIIHGTGPAASSSPAGSSIATGSRTFMPPPSGLLTLVEGTGQDGEEALKIALGTAARIGAAREAWVQRMAFVPAPLIAPLLPLMALKVPGEASAMPPVPAPGWSLPPPSSGAELGGGSVGSSGSGSGAPYLASPAAAASSSASSSAPVDVVAVAAAHEAAEDAAAQAGVAWSLLRLAESHAPVEGIARAAHAVSTVTHAAAERATSAGRRRRPSGSKASSSAAAAAAAASSGDFADASSSSEAGAGYGFGFGSVGIGPASSFATGAPSSSTATATTAQNVLSLDTAAFASLPACAAIALKGGYHAALTSAAGASASGSGSGSSSGSGGSESSEAREREMAEGAARAVVQAAQVNATAAHIQAVADALLASARTCDMQRDGSVAPQAAAEGDAAAALPPGLVSLPVAIEAGMDASSFAALCTLSLLTNGCGQSLHRAAGAGPEGVEDFLRAGALWGWALQRGEEASVRHAGHWAALASGSGGARPNTSASAGAGAGAGGGAGAGAGSAAACGAGPAVSGSGSGSGMPSSSSGSAYTAVSHAVNSGWTLSRMMPYLLHAGEDGPATCMRRLRAMHAATTASTAAAASESKPAEVGLPAVNLRTVRAFAAEVQVPAAAAREVAAQLSAAGVALGGSGGVHLADSAAVAHQLMCETLATLEELRAWGGRVQAALRAADASVQSAVDAPALLRSLASPQGLLVPLACGHNAGWSRQERQLGELAVRHMLAAWKGDAAGDDEAAARSADSEGGTTMSGP